MIKQEVYINAIYQHYKGDYYKVINIAFHHEDQDLKSAVVIYHKCDEHGIFKSIRYKKGAGLSGLAKGAAAGAAFGPWGAVVGGAIGGITGLVNNKKAKEDENYQNVIISQPFYRNYNEFIMNIQGGYPNNPAIPRFKFIKQL